MQTRYITHLALEWIRIDFRSQISKTNLKSLASRPYSFEFRGNILKIHGVDHSSCSLQVLIYSCPFFLFKIMVSLWNVQSFQGTLSIYMALSLGQWNLWHWLVEPVWSTEYWWIFYSLVGDGGKLGWNICSPSCMKTWKALLSHREQYFIFHMANQN